MRAAALVLAVFLGAACGGRRQASAPVDEKFTGTLAVHRPGEVVAQVNGSPIYADEVLAQAREKRVSAEAALEELVAHEVLAQEAARRGLVDDPAVVTARRQTRVRRFIETVFAPTFDGPEDVREDELETLWKRPDVRAYYDHPEYHTVAYFRVGVPDGATPAEGERLRGEAVALRERVMGRRPESGDAFLEAAVAEARGLTLDHGHFSTSFHEGPAVPEFALLAFTLATPGQVSVPGRTQWGWDVLYLEEVLPERRWTKDQAFADMRKERFLAARREAFMRWADGLVAASEVSRPDDVGRLLDRVRVETHYDQGEPKASPRSRKSRE